MLYWPEWKEVNEMPLPIMTTAEDVLAMVKYLKNKPTGATLSEARAAVGNKTTDGRKLAGYQTWGVVVKDGDRLKLADAGWELARKPDQQQVIFRSILDRVKPYRSVLEWVFHQGLNSVTNNDVAAHWHEHQAEALGTTNEESIKDSAVCFFHLCQAAGLGTIVFGRRGQATRLEITRDQLASYIEAGPSSPPWTPEPAVEEFAPQDTSQPAAAPLTTYKPSDEELRVFIAHGKNMAIVEQVKTMLDLASIGNEVAEEEETPAIPVSDKVFNAMRRCKAGIIVVSAEEGKKDGQGSYSINENVLIEVGAAFVLYEKRVVLLWDRRLPVPSNLQGLYRCDFEGNELSWAAGMKLMKAINGFKK